MKQLLFMLCAAVCASVAQAQPGGERAYAFLKANHAVKSAALGGAAVAPVRSDVAMAAHNPALLDSAMHRSVSLTHLSYPAGAAHSSVAAAWHRSSVGTLGLSVVSLSYGALSHTDEHGEPLGRFSASELAAALLYARTVWHGVSVGAALSAITSQLERYRSSGVGMSVGARYRSPDRLLNASLSFNNVGFQLRPYTEGSRQKLPFEVQLAVAKKLEKAPFGLSLTLSDLQSWRTYTNTDGQRSAMYGDGQTDGALAKAGKELMSHAAMGVQIIPSRYFFLMGGYSFRRRNDLRVGERSGAAGFSFGFGVALKALELGYARTAYHAGQAGHHVQLMLSL